VAALAGLVEESTSVEVFLVTIVAPALLATSEQVLLGHVFAPLKVLMRATPARSAPGKEMMAMIFVHFQLFLQVVRISLISVQELLGRDNEYKARIFHGSFFFARGLVVVSESAVQELEEELLFVLR
jgi:hypothetical protein